MRSFSLLDIPSFILRVGCVNVINLDNDGSMAMYNNTRYIVGPGRNIMDAFIIVKK